MIIDVNEDVTSHLPALAKAGVTDIIGYLNPHGMTGKVVTPQRAKAIGAAGMTLALVSEGWGDFQHGDISGAKGKGDAEHALAALAGLGASPNAVVYFAVDTDASTSQITSLVIPYFRAIHDAFAGTDHRVGVYGSGAVCNAVLASMLADFAWLSCSLGWLGSKEFLASKKWTLRQHVPSKVAGVDCDVNDASGPDWGQFAPFQQIQPIADVNVPMASMPAGIKLKAVPVVVASADARLAAATGAIHAMLANGIANFVPDWPSWLKVDIPQSALEHMAPALAAAALSAIKEL